MVHSLHKNWPHKSRSWWIAPAFFASTLLPLGSYDTRLGMYSVVCAVIWLAMSVVTYAIIRLLARFPLKMRAPAQAHKTARLYTITEWKCRFLVTTLPALISYIIGKIHFDNLPVVYDSIAQYAHARLIANGVFSVASPPLAEFFPMVHIINDGQWYSQYQPGHMLILAIGHVMGVPYLIEPLLCGLSALLLYLIAYDHYGLRIARLTGILTIFCPLWWNMGSEYMNHNTSLFGLLLFTWAWLRILKNSSIAHSTLAGFGLGLALVTRPLTALAVALPFGLYGLQQRWKCAKWRGFMILLPAGFITALWAIFQLYFNQKTTDDWLTFAPHILYGDQVEYGFGHTVTSSVFEDFYVGTAHTLWRGIGHLFNNLIGLNAFLFNWPLPSLFFVCWGMMIFRPSRISRLMLWSWGLLAAIYIPYFYQDWCFGPRYMYEISGFLIIATAIGIRRTPANLRLMGWRMKRSDMNLRINSALLLLYVNAAVLMYVGVPSVFSKCSVSSDHLSATAIDALFPDHSLVFANRSYGALTVFMPPLESNRVIYAKDLGMKNAQLIALYPGRTIFIERGNEFIPLNAPEQQGKP